MSENLDAPKTQVSLDERQLHDSGEVPRLLLESRQEPAAFLQPSDQPFDDVAAAVGVGIEFDLPGVSIFVLLGGNHRLDPQTDQVVVDPSGPVPLVAAEGVGPEDWFASAVLQRLVRALQQFGQRGGFVGLSGGQVEVEGVAVPVAEDVDLRGKSAPGTSQGVVLGFVGPPFFRAPAAHLAARTVVPSTHHN